MKFQEIQFKDPNAKRLYRDYITRVNNVIKSLNKENKAETLLEINSHIYEAFVNTSGDEVSRLLNIFDKLGYPEVFLKELVGEKKLHEATQSFNPLKIIKALFYNITNGISYFLFLVLYLSLFSFIFLIFAKLFDPKNVGFFYRKHDIFILGKIKNGSFNYQQYEQWGDLFIPIMLVLTIALYFIITLLLKIVKRLKK